MKKVYIIGIVLGVIVCVGIILTVFALIGRAIIIKAHVLSKEVDSEIIETVKKNRD